MAEFQNTINLLGDEVVTKALIEKTITEFRDNVLTSIRAYAFCGCSSLETVDMPNVTSVKTSAFQDCSLLESINMPAVTGEFPNYVFRNCPSLKIADYPNITRLGNHVFLDCTSLTTANFPNVSSNNTGVFENCSSLTSVNLPLLAYPSKSLFSGCSSLSNIDLPNSRSLQSSVFNKCTVLKTVILRHTSLVTLSNTNAFTGTPFASGGTGGTLLVPRSLTASYQTATNWSSIFSGNANNRVLALEDYTIDGTITGEIDWDKLGGTT